MTREEFGILAKGMKAVYTQATFLPDQNAFNVWYELLKDLSYEQANIAIQKIMLTSKFPPTISEIREQAYETVTGNEVMNELSAWALVSKALRNGYYGAETEFEKLPPLVQKAVGQPSNLRQWAMAEADSVETVIQSNFCRTYRTVVAREMKKEMLPQPLKDRIASTQQNLIGGFK